MLGTGTGAGTLGAGVSVIAAVNPFVFKFFWSG